jgi:hypothetical protein
MKVIKMKTENTKHETKTKFPGVTFLRRDEESIKKFGGGKYVWLSSDPSFRIGDKPLDSDAKPGEECPEGWRFALRLHKVMKKACAFRPFDFSVTTPRGGVCATERYVNLKIVEPLWLKMAIEKGLGISSEQIYESLWKKRGFIGKLQRFVDSVWGAYQLHATHWENGAQIARNLDQFPSRIWEPEKEVPIPGFDAKILVYPDGSQRILGADYSGHVDWPIPPGASYPRGETLEQRAENIALDWEAEWEMQNPGLYEEEGA